ncbi:class I SAM-dependent methyltransferase [Candidatus Woesebacteria bacterium]|nr:class I SAM-dependent methyltransferase [Candidatus Woesebacteria bacterium]
MHQIVNPEVYLARMSKPLAEKLKIVHYLPEKPLEVLDVGCADGAVTIEMARMFPETHFHGIDINPEFISRARDLSAGLHNVTFETIYLRNLLAREQKFDAVTFCSVLHEFASYGEGLTSVVKALADAHELLKKHGRIVIRDMIFSGYKQKTDFGMKTVLLKIQAKKELASLISDFETHFGKLNDIYTINHFLLKYKYTDNWDREGHENYVPVTFDQYEQIFTLLGMKVLYRDSKLLPYFEETWKQDFGFSDQEIQSFRSTGFFAVEK